MPDDLDDFDLEPTRRRGDEETVTPYRPDPEKKGGGILFPVTLAAVAVVAVGLMGIVFLVFRHPSARPSPSPSAAALAATPAAAPSPTPSPEVPLPPLDESDAFVRQLAAGLSAHPELARWLARTALVRTLTAVVANVADGETPRPHLEFLAPKQRFRAARRPARLDRARPRRLRGLRPLRRRRRLGRRPRRGHRLPVARAPLRGRLRRPRPPRGRVPGALDRAIRALLAVPVLRDDVELVPHAIGFKYADPKLEGPDARAEAVPAHRPPQRPAGAGQAARAGGGAGAGRAVASLPRLLLPGSFCLGSVCRSAFCLGQSSVSRSAPSSDRDPSMRAGIEDWTGCGCRITNDVSVPRLLPDRPGPSIRSLCLAFAIANGPQLSRARAYSWFMHDGSRSPLTDASRPLAALSDDDLLRRLAEILTRSRRVERDLIAHVPRWTSGGSTPVRPSRPCSRIAPGLFTSRRARPTCESPWPGPRASTRFSWRC